MDGGDGLTIALGATTTGLIVREAIAFFRARSQRTTIAPDPLNVKSEDKFITRGECKRLMCAHDAQISELRSEIKSGNLHILQKLDEMDSRSEVRAKEAHARIDPLVKEIAKSLGQVELVKEAFLHAAVGGAK